MPAVQNTVYVGGVIGFNEGVTLDNVSTHGSITIANHSSSYSSYGGGLIGYSLVDCVSNCVNNANISAKTAAGGIIGYKGLTAETNHFTSNTNNGDVSNAFASGGMIGCAELAFVQNCKNTGSITALNNAAGLVGKSYGGGQTCGQVQKMGLFNPQRMEEQAHYICCENERFREDLRENKRKSEVRLNLRFWSE